MCVCVCTSSGVFLAHSGEAQVPLPAVLREATAAVSHDPRAPHNLRQLVAWGHRRGDTHPWEGVLEFGYTLIHVFFFFLFFPLLQYLCQKCVLTTITLTHKRCTYIGLLWLCSVVPNWTFCDFRRIFGLHLHWGNCRYWRVGNKMVWLLALIIHSLLWL